VLLFLALLFADAFLARGFRSILCLLSAAMRRAEKKTGAKKDSESAAQRLPQRDPRMHVLLRRTGEVSAVHFPTHFGETTDGGILLKVGLRDNGILLGKRY